MHADNNVILSGARDGSVCLVNWPKNRIIRKIQSFEESVESVDFCSQINMFLAASIAGEIKVYEVESLQTRVSIKVGYGITKSIWVGFEIIVSTIGGKLKCFDGRSGEGLRKWIGHEDTVLDFDVKHDKIISGSEDQRILIHNFRLPS